MKGAAKRAARMPRKGITDLRRAVVPEHSWSRPEGHAQHAKASMITPLLPNASAEACQVLRKTLPDLGVELMVGVAVPITNLRPGNGGFRIWNYNSGDDAASEAIALAQGMEVKHAAYNTGFAGAKVVCDARNANIADIDKSVLLHEAAILLDELNGTMYTGCDLNTTTQDMGSLATQSPYVLAAIGNEKANPNDATAFGVLGALQACFPDFAGKTFLVHGCGGVGGTVAAELVRAGANVYTRDLSPTKADVFGATNISDGMPDAMEEWWTLDVDAIVPCSASGLIDQAKAEQLGSSCKLICGATNLPFASSDVQNFVEQRGVTFVPEGVTSAGAVIMDSVEHYDPQAFEDSSPMDLYEFCRNKVLEKTHQLLEIAVEDNVSVASATPQVMDETLDSDCIPVGETFRHWQSGRRSVLRSPTMNGAANSRRVRSFGTSARGLSTSSRGFSTSSRGFCSSPSATNADVVICGAGIMGLNIAYQLKRRDPGMHIIVLERFPTIGYGSSGYSTGFQRAYYSQDNTMRLALDGIAAYKNWGEYTGLGADAEAYFTETGALWMLGKQKEENELMVKRLAAFGVDSEVMNGEDVTKRFPAMSVDPFPEFDDDGELVERDYGEFSAVYEVGCGHLDSTACLRDMLKVCESHAVDVRFKTRVSKVETAGGRATGVTTEEGVTYNAPVVLNCMGPWFGQLNDSAAVTTSTTMLPTRIQVGHKHLPDDEDFLGLPFVADFYGPSGIYFMPRRANKQLVFGSVAHRFESEVVDPDNYNESLDPDVKQDYLNCLFHRLPTLPTSGEIHGFSHMYTVNQEDVHPVIGESDVSGLYLCNGFSGHGFKLAPGVGSLVAQQITGSTTSSWETTCPLDFLSASREPLSLKVKTHFA